MPDLELALQDALDWAENLRDSGGPNVLTFAHLKTRHEAKEFADDPSIEEAADICICLIAALRERGWSTDDLSKAIVAKNRINRGRTWFQESDGTWQHVKNEVAL